MSENPIDAARSVVRQLAEKWGQPEIDVAAELIAIMQELLAAHGYQLPASAILEGLQDKGPVRRVR